VITAFKYNNNQASVNSFLEVAAINNNYTSILVLKDVPEVILAVNSITDDSITVDTRYADSDYAISSGANIELYKANDLNTVTATFPVTAPGLGLQSVNFAGLDGDTDYVIKFIGNNYDIGLGNSVSFEFSSLAVTTHSHTDIQLETIDLININTTSVTIADASFVGRALSATAGIGTNSQVVITNVNDINDSQSVSLTAAQIIEIENGRLQTAITFTNLNSNSNYDITFRFVDLLNQPINDYYSPTALITKIF